MEIVTVPLDDYMLHAILWLTHRSFDGLSCIFQGAATVFSTWDFIRRRNEVEMAMERAVKERLGGRCCEHNCVATGKLHCRSKSPFKL